MNSEERDWLQQKLSAGERDLSADDLDVLLGDPSLEDNALLAGIDFVKVWLSRQALPYLIRIAASENRSMEVRAAAARALAESCDSQTGKLLREALSHNLNK